MKQAALLILAAVFTASTASGAFIVPDSYTYNTTIDNQASAETGNLLTDNEVGEGSWNGGDYVGFGDAGTNAWASVTFTFDDTYDFEAIDLYSYSTFTAGYVNVSTSTDNVTFSSPTQYILSNTAVGGTKSSDTDSLDVTALADAKYIKIDWFKTPTYPGEGNWVFLSEVDFSIVPEPASLVLVGLGGLLIAGRGRRRC